MAALPQANALGAFPAPTRWLTFANALTPRAYAQLQPLIASQSLGEVVSSASPVSITGIDLGALGPGWLVFFRCGSENCPAVAFVQQGAGFRQILRPSWGAGFTVGASKDAVPDIYGWNHVGGGQNSVSRYRYDGHNFVADGCVVISTGASCGASSTTVFPVPPLDVLPATSPDALARLRPLLEVELRALPQAQRDEALAGMRLVSLGRYAAVATANCDGSGNCPIYVFDHQGGTDEIVLRANGTAIAEVAARPGDPGPPQLSLVIRRHSLAAATELVRYASERPPRNYSGILPVPFATWAPEACELEQGTAIEPIYCANGAPIPKPARALDSTPILGAAQDASGTVWGVTLTGLERWDNDHWEPVPPVVADTVPTSSADGRWLWPTADGGVEMAMLTRGSPRKLALIWRRGERYRLEYEIPPTGDVLPTATGPHLLFTGDGIDQIGPDGIPQRVFTSQPDQRTVSLPHINQVSPLHATADAQGRLWIWQPYIAGPRVVLAPTQLGLLIEDQGRFSYHASLPGLPQGTLAFLSPWDNKHLVAGFHGEGLFLIDTQTLTAQPVMPPEPGALLQAQMVFASGSDRYVVVGTPAQPVQTAVGDLERSDVVWRWREGHWQRVLVGLDGRRFAPAHTGLTAGDGVWISSAGQGDWFIPRGSGPPVLANWRSGLPLAEVSAVFALHGGKLLLVDEMDHTTVAMPEAVLKRPVAAPLTIVDHPGEAEPEMDAHGHLWTMRLHSLDEWDGARWQAHALPLAIAPGQVSGIMADTHGSIWVLPAPCRMGPAAVLDPATNTWRVFGSYILGLLRAGYQVDALHARYRLQPVNGPGGQIMSWGYCNGVSYFNGRRWSIWNVGQFPGPAHAMPQAPPYFDASGRPAVNVGIRESFAWDGNAWQPIPYQPQAPEPQPGPSPPAPPPANCPTQFPESLTTDTLGRTWWTAAGNLYEAANGSCRIVLAAGQAQPFIDGRTLGRALADANGNVFLQTWPSDRYVYLKGPF